MTAVTVYDPAMCCSTGICGTDVDQRLVDLAADLDWLKAQGVNIQRFGLSREPAEFAVNDIVRQIMQASEGDDLPVFLVDRSFKAKVRYPAVAELAEWAGIADDAAGPARKASACCRAASQQSSVSSGCCRGGAKRVSETEKAGNGR